ncbi:DUF2911 domain-containing protein [Albibacterium bauzanense]|uniref:DUF2911 family protein n=1 Tax=Albibacterium bauzanense TaxID=653929 RepID=A0A4V2PY59_9SPHI|nr:DUF2911 domain-containing protein [Albibacterium bauzanense]TCK84741.1 Protein of unknown function (DUF2911) [Albibacterium bauzanense]
MKIFTLKQSLMSMLFLLMSTAFLFAQNNQPPASPAATATGKFGNATVTITYSSPAVKGREIFGGLVPYDKVWRAGANQATILETTAPIQVEGKNLPAGKYTLFMLPTANNGWTVILNSETGQWGIQRTGEANLDRSKDVLTASVKPAKSSTMHERLVYEFNTNGFSLSWDNLTIPVSVK